MSRGFVVTFAVGLIVALFGVIWALQGFGVLGGSPMSNTTTWSVIGPITALVGIAIAVISWRKLVEIGCYAGTTAKFTVCQPVAPSGTGLARSSVWTAPVLSMARTVMVSRPGLFACHGKRHNRHVSLE